MGNYIKERQIPMKTLPILDFEQCFLFLSQITLVLKEKVFSLSGDDFKITDIIGNPYFKIKGKTFNISKKKMLYVMYYRPIFSMKHELFSLRGRYRFFFKDSENLTVKVDPLRTISKIHYEVIFVNLLNGKNEQLELICDFIGSVCGIFYRKAKEGAPMICKIRNNMMLNYFLQLKKII